MEEFVSPASAIQACHCADGDRPGLAEPNVDQYGIRIGTQVKNQEKRVEVSVSPPTHAASRHVIKSTTTVTLQS